MVKPPRATPLVSPLNWLALAAVVVLVIAAGLWATTSTIPRMVDGRGVIIRNSDFGIFEVEGSRDGTLDKVFVKEGDVVTAGQPVAELRHASLRLEISKVEKALADAPEGTPKRLSLEDLLRKLHSRLETERFIRSAQDGRVIEVALSPGNVILPGKTILRLESLSGNHEALVYVSALEGKRIRPGMEARIVPTTAPSEKGGYLRARVSYVSPHPVTRNYLVRELGGNERLADWLLEQDARTELVLELLHDSTQPDGYAWSSGKPATPIESGLLVEAHVVFDNIRPISWWLTPDRE